MSQQGCCNLSYLVIALKNFWDKHGLKLSLFCLFRFQHEHLPPWPKHHSCLLYYVFRINSIEWKQEVVDLKQENRNWFVTWSSSESFPENVVDARSLEGLQKWLFEWLKEKYVKDNTTSSKIMSQEIAAHCESIRGGNLFWPPSIEMDWLLV